VSSLEAMSEHMASLLAAGTYFGNDHQDKLWANAILRLVGDTGNLNGDWGRLRLYSPLICLYSSGVAALAAGRYSFLKAALIDTPALSRYEKPQPLRELLSPFAVMGRDFGNQALFDNDRKYVPISERLFELVRPLAKPYLSSEQDYELLFDRFEYMWSLICADCSQDMYYIPIGRYGWKFAGRGRHAGDIVVMIDSESKEMSTKWPPFKAGLFCSDATRFGVARDRVIKAIEGRSWH
jgi:hypothetical protein